MRSLQEAEGKWQYLIKHTTYDQLAAATSETHGDPTIEGQRSACWKIFLLFDNFDQGQWLAKLRTSRDAFESLKHHFLQSMENEDEVEDPLNDDVESAWNSLKKDEALRDEIYLDVDRCMPENLYFREPHTQKILTDILFVWSKLNQDTSYRQGMHELLAPILWVVERDAVNPASIDSDSQKREGSVVRQMFDEKSIAHDSFTLFSAVMQHEKASYEQSSGRVLGSRSLPSARDQSAIVLRCQNIIDRMLARTDPALAAHLKSVDVVPQVFLIRWIRLLFGREFSFEQTLQVWDRIFAEDPSCDCVDFICLAMLLRIRWELLECDNSGALRLLLHYPEPAESDPPPTFVADALYLRDNLSTDGGYYIIAQRTRRPPPKSSPSPALSTPRRPYASFVNPAKFKEQSSGLEALLHTAAREVYSRGEKLGVNQAVRDAVQEVRKNVQGHSRTASQSGIGQSSINSTDKGSGALLRQIDTLKERNKTLAKMLESAISELWKEQKERDEKKVSSKEDGGVFTMAIAKVQLVQLYLEEPSLALPLEQSQESTKEDHDIIEKATKGDTTDVAKAPAAVVHPDAGRAASNFPEVRLETSTPSLQSIDDYTKKSIHTPEHSPPQTTAFSNKSARPRLNEPSFSWILGQDQPMSSSTSARSTFLSSTSPFSMPDQQQLSNRKSAARGSAAYLFGDEDEGQGSKPIATPSRAKPGSRAKDKSKGPPDDELEEVFVLGALKGK